MHSDHNINKLNICQNGGMADAKCKREERQEIINRYSTELHIKMLKTNSSHFLHFLNKSFHKLKKNIEQLSSY